MHKNDYLCINNRKNAYEKDVGCSFFDYDCVADDSR